MTLAFTALMLAAVSDLRRGHASPKLATLSLLLALGAFCLALLLPQEAADIVAARNAAAESAAESATTPIAIAIGTDGRSYFGWYTFLVFSAVMAAFFALALRRSLRPRT